MRKLILTLIGPVLFIFTLLLPVEDLSFPALAVLGLTIWMAIWWIGEVAPVAVTALLPAILYPLCQVMPMKEVMIPYSHPMIYLYMGGFIIALAMERWELHRRIALSIIISLGTDARRIVLGFMLATALLSMWISNSATTVMMLPIALAIIDQIEKIAGPEHDQVTFSKVLMLSIAYAASIGGIGTLVGTPTNLVLSGFVESYYGVEISFASWFMFGFPISMILLGIAYLHLVHVAFKVSSKAVEGGKQLIRNELNKLGPISAEEKWVLGIFSLVALAWISRTRVLNIFLPDLNDTHIALIGASLLFIIPAPSDRTKSLMDWNTALKLPWGVLLLFGGAFAIALGFDKSGLAQYIGNQLGLLKDMPFWIVLLVVVSCVCFLTEITQNVATSTLLMPIMASLAVTLAIHPYGLIVPACIAASCAFMLPVATPPNVMVFSSGYLTVSDMARTGFWLNILAILIIVLAAYLFLPWMWDISWKVVPEEFLRTNS